VFSAESVVHVFLGGKTRGYRKKIQSFLQRCTCLLQRTWLATKLGYHTKTSGLLVYKIESAWCGQQVTALVDQQTTLRDDI
jgi:hypothetical protein